MDHDPSPPTPPAQPSFLRHTEPHPPGLFAAEHPGSPGPEPEAPKPAKGTQDDQTLPLWPVCGHAPGASWRRETEGGRPDLPAKQLMLAVRAVDKHAGHGRRNGREWRGTDGATMRELEARTWGVGELSRLYDVRAPRWLEPFCFKVASDGRRFGCARWLPFLGVLVAAYRAGAVGVRLSYEEIASEFGCSRRTAARWVADMRKIGLLSVVRIWTADNCARERERRRNVYQVGATIEGTVGPALLDGCSDVVRGTVRKATAKRCGMAARARARTHWRDHQRRAWAAQRVPRPRSEAGSCSPGAARRPPGGPSGAVGDRGSDMVAPQPPSPSGRTHRRPRGPDGGLRAAPGEHEPASLRAAPAPAGPAPNDGDTKPDANARGGAGARLSRGASAVPPPAAAEPGAALERPAFALGDRLAQLAPALAAGASAQLRMALGCELDPCPGCRGRGHVRSPSGDTYRCCACDGSGERTPRGSRRADA